MVTLSDINITPLLDLAFVLLIIFVITTPLLEQTIPLALPGGGKKDRTIRKDDVRVIEVAPKGGYVLSGRKMTLDQIERELVKAHSANSNLVVRIRADRREYYERVLDVLDRCERHGITQVGFATAVER